MKFSQVSLRAAQGTGASVMTDSDESLLDALLAAVCFVVALLAIIGVGVML